jgi:hypothetical protein
MEKNGIPKVITADRSTTDLRPKRRLSGELSRGLIGTLLSQTPHARRRKEERRTGLASRGIMRRWGPLLLPCAPRGLSLSTLGCLLGATPRGQPWTSTVPLPPGRSGLIAWRMAVLSTFRAPARCRQGHCELLRSALLNLTPIIPAVTACHQRNDVERYSRFRKNPFKQIFSTPSGKRNRVFPSTEIVYIKRRLTYTTLMDL